MGQNQFSAVVDNARRRRVNSLKRLRYAASIGCHSADGTCLAFGPDRNLPRLLGWLTQVNAANPAITTSAAFPPVNAGPEPV